MDFLQVLVNPTYKPVLKVRIPKVYREAHKVYVRASTSPARPKNSAEEMVGYSVEHRWWRRQRRNSGTILASLESMLQEDFKFFVENTSNNL